MCSGSAGVLCQVRLCAFSCTYIPGRLRTWATALQGRSWPSLHLASGASTSLPELLVVPGRLSAGQPQCVQSNLVITPCISIKHSKAAPYGNGHPC